jgi:hypothetical protein
MHGKDTMSKSHVKVALTYVALASFKTLKATRKVTGPERGNRNGVTRKAAEKLPKKMNLGGPWHGTVPLSVVTPFPLPLSGPVDVAFDKNRQPPAWGPPEPDNALDNGSDNEPTSAVHKLFAILDLCVSSLRRGRANLPHRSKFDGWSPRGIPEPTSAAHAS